LKPELWGSPLVQENFQAEKACDKRHPYRILLLLIIIIVVVLVVVVVITKQDEMLFARKEKLY
jgi:surface polysaccharide O-acyltransferase-like enzyme